MNLCALHASVVTILNEQNKDAQGEAIGFALQPKKKTNKQDMEEHRGK